MTNYKIFVGLNNQFTKTQLQPTDFYINFIRKHLACRNIDGATIYNAVGVYNNESENTLIIEILKNNNIEFSEFDYLIYDFCQLIKYEFDQESILIEKQNIYAEFI